MLILTVLILCMYYIYRYNYPLLRDDRSTDVACILHSTLTVFMVPLPSSSLLLLAIIHYRAVFWTKYDSKLNIKSVLLPILLIWLASILLALLWTSLHEQYNEWYCLPFSRSLFSIILQSTISIVCLVCLFLYVKLYVELIIYVHKEELTVMAMRSRKVSRARMLLIRFTITMFSHISQLVLMNTLLWLPLFGINDTTTAMIFVAYMLTVACTDLYQHCYVLLKNRFSDFRSSLIKK